MDIQFYGANCIALSGKLGRIVVDDNLAELGGKAVAKDGDICLFTGQQHPAVAAKAKIVVDMPGEYEVNNISVFGLQARAHTDEADQRSAIVYKITWGETRLLVTGHVYPELTEDELENIGLVDIMFVPVGGNGFTLDGIGALKLIKQVEPKLVVPTYYADSLHYPVPAQKLEEALKALGMEPKETTKKLQFKPADVTDTTQLVILEKA